MSIDTVDKCVLRIIATVQLIASLLGIPLVIFSFNYGGASVHPNWFTGLLLYFICGFGIAVFLYFGHLSARILALLWHATFIGYPTLSYIRASQAHLNTEISGIVFGLFISSALCVWYFGATSFSAVAKGSRKQQ